MKITCSLGIHEWNGCTCVSCGIKRKTDHNWEKDCEKCSVCGQTRTKMHKWKDESCTLCGTKMDSRAELLFKEFQGVLTDVPLIPQLCKEVINQAFMEGATLDSAAEIFSNEFKNDPKRFIDEDKIIWRTVEKIMVDMKSALSGVTILEAPCKKKLFSDMKSGMTPQNAVDSLVNAIKSNPSDYIIRQTYYYPPSEYRREGTDKGAIGHDMMNVRTLDNDEWERRTAFLPNHVSQKNATITETAYLN